MSLKRPAAGGESCKAGFFLVGKFMEKIIERSFQKSKIPATVLGVSWGSAACCGLVP